MATEATTTTFTNGYEAHRVDHEYDMIGEVTYFAVTRNGDPVGKVRVVDGGFGGKVTVTARNTDGTEVTTENLDRYNDDNGDRDLDMALYHGVGAVIAEVEG